MGALASVVLATVLSCVLTGLATWYASRSGVLNHPGERHSHTRATPSGGGAGLVATLLLMSLVPLRESLPAFWISAVLPGTLLLALIGWWDDHRPLSARFRFLVQLIVCAHTIWIAIVLGWLPSPAAVALAGFYVLWMINLYNFMDGSNGMAGLQGVFAALLMAWLFQRAGDGGAATAACLTAAVCTGFLPWNLVRPRVFMGDVGSLSLGFIFSALVLYGIGSGTIPLPVAWLPMAVFLTDSTLTLLVRVLKGEQWYNAHRQHLYQRLITQGWTHGRVALFYQLINLVLILPGVIVAVNFPVYAWPIALVMALILGLGWWLMVRQFGVLAEAG